MVFIDVTQFEDAVWSTRCNFPEHFQEVLEGKYYWEDPIHIEWNGYETQFSELGSYRYIDLRHPRCYYCGKFVRKGNWWRYEGWTGPCTFCYENTSWL